MIQIKAPDILSWEEPLSLFLAGSIEMDTAEHWQDRLVKELSDYDIAILNPRRDDWDASWVQSITNPQFKEQVTWELNAIDKSNVVAFYFDPNTKSPITLMEFGFCAADRDMVVCCPDGFWRKGNVEVVCDRFGIMLVNTFDELVSALKKTDIRYYREKS
jgi:hypothetical protein